MQPQYLQHTDQICCLGFRILQYAHHRRCKSNDIIDKMVSVFEITAWQLPKCLLASKHSCSIHWLHRYELH